MIANNILVIILLAPLLGALAILFINNKLDEENKNSSYVALWISGAVFLSSVLLFFDKQVSSQLYIQNYAENFADFAFSFNKYFSLTHISIIMICLTAFIMLMSFVIGYKEINKKRKIFAVLVLLLESICCALFSTNNIVIFYACFEAILVPMYLILGINGSNFRVGRKFFICLLIGSIFLLAGIIYMISLTGVTNINSLANFYFSKGQAAIIFLTIFIGLAFKTAIFPFHMWLPDAHTLAPTSASIILSGIFLKIGAYGLLVLLVNILPKTGLLYSRAICCLSAVGVIYGAVMACLKKDDFKRIIAYSSISHIGIIVIGIFSFDSLGISGAIFQIVSHSITSCGLFIIAYTLKENGINSIYKMVFFIIFLSGISFPLTSNFIGEFYILSSVFYTHTFSSICIILTEFISIFYILDKFRKTFFIAQNEKAGTKVWLNIPVAIISGIIVLLGIFSHQFMLYTFRAAQNYL